MGGASNRKCLDHDGKSLKIVMVKSSQCSLDAFLK